MERKNRKASGDPHPGSNVGAAADHQTFLCMEQVDAMKRELNASEAENKVLREKYKALESEIRQARKENEGLRKASDDQLSIRAAGEAEA